jgi:hypothetical protein
LVYVFEIIQESPATIDHAEQSSAGVMIFVMSTEVVSELADPGRQ